MECPFPCLERKVESVSENVLQVKKATFLPTKGQPTATWILVTAQTKALVTTQTVVAASNNSNNKSNSNHSINDINSKVSGPSNNFDKLSYDSSNSKSNSNSKKSCKNSNNNTDKDSTKKNPTNNTKNVSQRPTQK